MAKRKKSSPSKATTEVVSSTDDQDTTDIKALIAPVLGHRLVLAGSASGKRQAVTALLDELLGQVAVPR